MAVLFSRHQQQCSEIFTAADKLLNLLEQLDAFCRSERFDLFLQCCELKFGSSRITQQLRDAYTACKAINAGELAEQGLKGKVIASALYDRRLTAINTSY